MATCECKRYPFPHAPHSLKRGEKTLEQKAAEDWKEWQLAARRYKDGKPLAEIPLYYQGVIGSHRRGAHTGPGTLGVCPACWQEAGRPSRTVPETPPF